MIGIFFSAVLASLYIYPIFSGLILLPLDLLVSNSGPWHLASTILLKNPYMVDSIIQMFPWKHLTFISLTHGIIPLWNPYQLMGMPFMAAMKPLVFYPANIFFFLGELRAWNILLWLQLFLSLWFTYLLMRSFKTGILSALFAAIAFAFNSLMVSVLEFGSEGHVLLWLPLLLYLVKRYRDTKNPWFIVGISLSTASAIFAGQLQYFAYIALVVAGFSLFYGSLLPILGIILGGCIAGIQLVPGIEMYQNSARGIIGSYATFSGGLLKPYHLLKLLSPDWFGNPVSHDLRGGYIESSGYFGIIPLFFMVYAMFVERKNVFVRFFTAVAALSLVFSMDGIAQILYIFRIPVITSGYGSRLFSMFLFAGAVLAGLGLKKFTRDFDDKKKLRFLLCYAGIAALCFVAGGAKLSNIKIQIAALSAFAVAAFVYIRYGKKAPFVHALFILAVLVLTFGDLFRMGYRFLTFSNEKFLYPDLAVTKFVREDAASSLGRVYGITEPEVDTYLGVYSTDTYNPLFPLRSATLLQALEDKKDARILNNKYELTRNPRMKMVLDFLGVTLIVVPKGQNPAITFWNSSSYEKDIPKVYEADGNDVYGNATARPRFGLFYDVRDAVPDQDALAALRSQSLDFGKTVLIAQRLDTQVAVGTGSAQLISSDVNSLKFTVESDTPALFYLSDSYDSGWHASVNGRETPVYRANYNFRAVLVPAGKSIVRFWYLPKSVIIGAIVSALGLIFTAGFVLVYKITNRHKDRDTRNREAGGE